jgi:hypothetical protein
MAYLGIIYQGLLTGLIIVTKLALVILPFMVLIEFAKCEYNGNCRGSPHKCAVVCLFNGAVLITAK